MSIRGRRPPRACAHGERRTDGFEQFCERGDADLLNSFGGVTAAQKRAFELQPAADGRCFQVVIDGERTWQSQRLTEARFGCAQRGSRADPGV